MIIITIPSLRTDMKMSLKFITALYLLALSQNSVANKHELSEPEYFEILHKCRPDSVISHLILSDKPIGSGGEGSVYPVDLRANHDEENIAAAIKLKLDSLEPQLDSNGFKREYAAMCYLQKRSFPFVPQTYAFLNFSTPIKGPAILMKRYGFDLSKVAGALKDGDFKKLAANIVDAVDQLHNHGIVHRDLKPENILYINQDEQSIVLTDYRAARKIGTPEKDAWASVTPHYWMEQGSWKKKGVVDIQEDLFSLGLSLFYLRHGKHLQDELSSPEWRASDIRASVFMIKDYKKYFSAENMDESAKYEDFSNRYQDQLDQLFIGLAHPDPEKRPSLEELKDALVP